MGNMELQTIVLYGKSGSGKGTQASLLKEYIEKKDPEHPVLYIETGAAFREFAKNDNYTAKLVKEVLESGGLLPEFLPVWVWTKFLIENVKGNEHIILDGLARQRDEVPVLYRAIKFYKRLAPKVVILTLSNEEAIARLVERGRNDDKEEEIKRRLAWYEDHVGPAIGMWRNISDVVVHEVASTAPIEVVHKNLVQELGFNIL